MGKIIKLVIAGFILYAVAQIGMAEFKYYQFQDAVHEVMLFSANAKDPDIIKQVLAVADEYDVPLEAGDVTVTRVRTEIRVNMSYNEDVTLIPGLYTKNWTFNPSSSIMTFGGGRLQR
jgi:hypothetical protein